jgi:hypothetical protein
LSVPALERVGADGVERLRARYREVIARVTERIADPAQRETTLASAERLNPDAWLTADAVTRGLEEYETVFASLRQIVGHRRRRRRHGRREAEGAPVDVDAPTAENTADSEDGDSADAAEPGDDRPDGESGSGGL